MDALDAILNRRSVRVFKEDPVDGKDLEKILKSGLAGPSACNRRPVELIVIEDKAVMASLHHLPPLRGIMNHFSPSRAL